MALASEYIYVARRALATMEELLNLNHKASSIVHDAAIHRFEYTYEAVRKAAEDYLKKVEGVDVGSPKGVIRASLQIGLLNAEQAELGLKMTDDRYLTVHMYDKELAAAMYNRLSEYAKLMGYWIEAMKKINEKAL